MEKEQLKAVFNRYLENQCTPEEVEVLMIYFHTRHEGQLSELVSNALKQERNYTQHEDQKIQATLDRVHHSLSQQINTDDTIPQLQPTIRKLWPRIAAAASILIAVAIGSYFVLHKKPTQQIAQNQQDILPGSNKAILTLSNGKQISLSDAKSGTIAKEAHSVIKKASNGTLSYEGNSANSDNQPLTFDIVKTPNGGQWPLILPDGTKVMLDAVSSIKYPVSFKGAERRVYITGQVYFEVAHNAKPFKVDVRGQTVEDLGTHFNINAYDDEPSIKTTLLEGRVKVSTPTKSLKLIPGQQSVMTTNGSLTKTEDVDIEEAVAWKNGYFKFNDEQITDIMKQLSRWYAIDVSYQGDVPNIGFNGTASRYKNITQVLNMLEATKSVHFKIDGRRIIISK